MMVMAQQDFVLSSRACPGIPPYGLMVRMGWTPGQARGDDALPDAVFQKKETV